MNPEPKYPNCCPFCGTHVNRGGAGQRHGTLHCGECFADYTVEFLGTYPDRERDTFEIKYQTFLESQPNGIEAMRQALESLDKNDP